MTAGGGDPDDWAWKEECGGVAVSEELDAPGREMKDGPDEKEAASRAVLGTVEMSLMPESERTDCGGGAPENTLVIGGTMALSAEWARTGTRAGGGEGKGGRRKEGGLSARAGAGAGGGAEPRLRACKREEGVAGEADELGGL